MPSAPFAPRAQLRSSPLAFAVQLATIESLAAKIRVNTLAAAQHRTLRRPTDADHVRRWLAKILLCSAHTHTHIIIIIITTRFTIGPVCVFGRHSTWLCT